MRIKVTDNFILKSKQMAQDLLGLAEMGNDKELKQQLRYHIKYCNKYLNQN